MSSSTQDVQTALGPDPSPPPVAGPPTPSATREVSRAWHHRVTGELARKVVPYLLIVGLVIYFGLSTPLFLMEDNGLQILRASSVLMVIAAGATLIIVAGSVDLSVGATAALAGTVAVDTMTDGGNAGILAALGTGLLCGAINGFLVAYAKLPSFLTTLGTLFIFDGIALKSTGGAAIPLVHERLDEAVNGSSVGSVPNIIWWAIAVLVLMCVVAYKTPFGRHVYAIGGNERVAALAGIHVQRSKFLLFTVSGLCAGVAGLMLVAQGGGSSPGMGDSFLLNSIAAIVMGGTALSGGVGGPARTVLGVLTLGIVANGMTLTQVDPNFQTVIFGVIVLFAVAVNVRRSENAIIK
ncbi:ABC transporter permease [Rhodococcus sp. NPDC057014]|uniref:ABC transporter permease n=1 Tax=Rhodococcus sp. NPDC057014 TaxID=3346000 RepID=UPI00363B46C0